MYTPSSVPSRPSIIAVAVISLCLGGISLLSLSAVILSADEEPLFFASSSAKISSIE